MKNVLAILVLLTFTGCMSFSDRPLRPVRNSIDQQLPEIRLEKEFAVSIGGGLFTFLDLITFNEADLSDLDKVQVAVYDVHPLENSADFSEAIFEESLRAKNDGLHWDTVVKVRSEGEQVWVLMGMNLERNVLEAVSVFVLQQSELVLIHVDGDLNDLIEFAMGPARGYPGAVKSS